MAAARLASRRVARAGKIDLAAPTSGTAARTGGSVIRTNPAASVASVVQASDGGFRFAPTQKSAPKPKPERKQRPAAPKVARPGAGGGSKAAKRQRTPQYPGSSKEPIEKALPDRWSEMSRNEKKRRRQKSKEKKSKRGTGIGVEMDVVLPSRKRSDAYCFRVKPLHRTGVFFDF